MVFIKVFALLGLLGLVDLTAGRHIKYDHSYKKHILAKKGLLNPRGGQQISPVPTLHPSCCASVQAPETCCQTISPPPCCQQQVLPVSNPRPSCCASVQAPVTCCQTASPPPCCQVPVTSVPVPAPICCTGVTSIDSSACCQAPNPAACCIHLGLKPGQSKNITLNSGGKPFLLNVKLIPLPTKKGASTTANPCATPAPPCPTNPCATPAPPCPTNPCATPAPPCPTNPCTIPTCPPTGSTTSPNGSTTASPTPGPTSGVTSGPTSGANTTGGAGGVTSPTQSPGDSMIKSCRRKALAEHNAKRLIHNSPPMALDNQLNQGAHNYANKLAAQKVPDLKNAHSPQGSRPNQGENLAMKCSKPASGFDCKTVTTTWYNEVKKYNFGAPGFSVGTGHFTQVVWKASTAFGIGRATYKASDGSTCYIVVGRYRPQGNVGGEFPTNVMKGSYTAR